MTGMLRSIVFLLFVICVMASQGIPDGLSMSRLRQERRKYEIGKKIGIDFFCANGNGKREYFS